MSERIHILTYVISLFSRTLPILPTQIENDYYYQLLIRILPDAPFPYAQSIKCCSEMSSVLNLPPDATFKQVSTMEPAAKAAQDPH